MFGMACVALVLGAVPAHATVIEVPLNPLEGAWTNEIRVVSVQLPAPPSVIHGISLKYAGSTELSTWNCFGTLAPAPGDVFASFELDHAEWIAAAPSLTTSGPFNGVVPFEPHFGATWDFLLDGTADLHFFVSESPGSAECEPVGPPHTTHLDGVSLLVDGEFPTPAAGTSWGRVKAIYR